MADSRVRIRIQPEATTFREVVARAWEGLKRTLRQIARFLARMNRDRRNPPSPERLWIRERGRAEMAEAELWFARHIAQAR